MTWLATTRHMWPEPIQLLCSKLFTHIELTVGTSVSERKKKKACQIQVLKENSPSDQENKEAFLEGKGHLLRSGKAAQSVCAMAPC